MSVCCPNNLKTASFGERFFCIPGQGLNNGFTETWQLMLN